MAKPSTGSQSFRIQIEEQFMLQKPPNSEALCSASRSTNYKINYKLNTQERINLERAEREQPEDRLEEERAERERLLKEERTSRLEFGKNMMTKFAELSQ